MSRLNGSGKYIGLVAVLIAGFGLLLGMVRYSQAQMSAFSEDYKERLLKVEDSTSRTDERLKNIDKTLDRIEAKLDRVGPQGW